MCPEKDPWAGGVEDPWAGAASAQPGGYGPPPEQPDWSLDAFGKGGKGKGPRGPLECYNCLGEGHPQFLCPSAKGAGKAGASPACGNCRGKGHSTADCPSKGGGKHVPKGKGKGGPPQNFFGGKGGKGGWGKGKGKGKGKISEFDDAGWSHVGAAAEWNWAAGSDWAAAATSEAQWPPAVAEAQPPWIAAAQAAWPTGSTSAWPSAPGGAPAAPPGLRSMSPMGGFHLLAPAPVPFGAMHH